MPDKPPFNLLRAVFWLLAAVIAFEMTSAVVAGMLCWWMNYSGKHELGACMPTTELIRGLFDQILTAVLALLLAGKSPPPG